MTKKAKREWCSKDWINVGYCGFRRIIKYKVVNGKVVAVYKKHKFNKRMRCPKCNRMLNVIIKECHDPGCVHLMLSPHKGKYK